MKIASLFSLLAVSALGTAQLNPSNEIIFTETKAIGLLPPLVVSGGTAQRAEWSPDGKYLLVTSQDMKLTPSLMSAYIAKGGTGGPPAMPEHIVTLFNVDKQTSTPVWRRTADVGSFSDVFWLPGGRSAVISVEVFTKDAQGKVGEPKQILYLLNAASGKLSSFYEAADGEMVYVDTDPRAKAAILVSRRYQGEPSPETSQARFILLSSDGRLGNAISVNGRASYAPVYWVTPDRPMLQQVRRVEGEKAKLVWSDMDFASGQLKPAADPQYNPPAEPKAEFDLRDGSGQAAAENKSVSLKSAWIVSATKGPYQSALVAAEVDGNSASLSPAGNAVYYSTKGVGMVRQLMSMPKELAMKALEAAQKAAIISDAKQMGLAFIIYASDMDDVLPSNSSDWMETVYPYIKNRSVMDGFVYTFAGGSMADIKDPASTVMGYKPGPGGRAVVYTDGHVRWEPDK